MILLPDPTSQPVEVVDTPDTNGFPESV